MMRGAIYARYSSDLQRPTSIEDQILACRRFAEQKGWTILEEHIYADEAVSGVMAGRKGYQALLRVALSQERPFEAVLVDDLSRLSRDELELMKTYRRFKVVGVRLISVADGIDTQDRFSKLSLRVKALYNDLFLDDLREKLGRAYKGRFERGYNPGGRVYGYVSVPEYDPSGRTDRFGSPVKLGSRIEIHEREAEVIRRIFHWYADGSSPREIVQQLNREGVSPPANGTKRHFAGWAETTIWRILGNEKYTGRWTYNKRIWEKDWDTGKRRARLRPPEEWLMSHREELQIISDELWEQVQARRQVVSAEFARSPKGRFKYRAFAGAYSPYLFSGFLRCGVCGGAMVVVGGNHTRELRYYGCSNNRDKGDSICPNGLRVSVGKVERHLLEAVKAKVLHPEQAQLVLERANHYLAERLQCIPVELAKLREDLDVVEEELGHIRAAIRKGLIANLTVEMLQRAEAQKQTLQAKIQQLEAEAKDPPKLVIHPQVLRQAVERIQDLLYRDVPAVRQELRKHLKSITLIPAAANGSRYYRAELEATMDGIFGGIQFERVIAVGASTSGVGGYRVMEA